MNNFFNKTLLLAAALGILDTNPFPKKNRNVSQESVPKETQEKLIAKAEAKRLRKAEKLRLAYKNLE